MFARKPPALAHLGQGAGRIQTREPVEDAIPVLRPDARAAVHHRHRDHVSCFLHQDAERRGPRLGGVVNEVQEHPLDEVGLGHGGAGLGGLYLDGVPRQSLVAGDASGDGGHIDRADIDAPGAFPLEFGGREELLDQPEKPTPLPFDGVQELRSLLPRELEVPQRDHAPQDRGQRIVAAMPHFDHVASQSRFPLAFGVGCFGASCTLLGVMATKRLGP